MPQARKFIKEIIIIIAISLAIVLPVRAFIAQPFVVSGDSMDNTFHNSNYLIVDELSYRFEDPKRGDIIVFKAPPKALALENVDPSKTVFYIKRIIGLPGETVQIDGDQVTIYNAANPNGFVLANPYAYFNGAGTSTTAIFENIHEKVTLGPDEYFVMGDNRHNSSDSRLWGILPKDNIQGRVLLRLLPPTQIGIFPGAYAY